MELQAIEEPLLHLHTPSKPRRTLEMAADHLQPSNLLSTLHPARHPTRKISLSLAGSRHNLCNHLQQRISLLATDSDTQLHPPSPRHPLPPPQPLLRQHGVSNCFPKMTDWHPIFHLHPSQCSRPVQVRARHHHHKMTHCHCRTSLLNNRQIATGEAVDDQRRVLGPTPVTQQILQAQA